ncbi:hypothetical protein HMF8227_01446 [Saliniradius amylolyticus]|uniref:Uncharacterized protein n=1 Tax=Saliniradius amylolyticus TaxID=2183582 RepID=A0A2S2E2Q2_9ALTE|nr:hypothetical protein [Saliniradius amylolyticus]AWL11921.1 hypothetical protein HMF8227_01446 [Saliniradius amylolyticus]
MSEDAQQPTQSESVAKLIEDAKGLIQLSKEAADVPGYRVDLQAKKAQELGPKAMQLSINLIEVVAGLDRRTISLSHQVSQLSQMLETLKDRVKQLEEAAHA